MIFVQILRARVARAMSQLGEVELRVRAGFCQRFGGVIDIVTVAISAQVKTQSRVTPCSRIRSRRWSESELGF